MSNTSPAEIYQDVSLAPYLARIDQGLQKIGYRSWFASHGLGNDETELIVEFWDASLTRVLSSAETGRFADGQTWQEHGEVLVVPAGTRTARVRVISHRLSGGENDGFQDDIALWAVRPDP